MNNEQIIFPFILTLLAGLSTAGGSFIFLSTGLCKKNYLGFFLGLSGGVMIYLSFMELLPTSIETIGFFSANLFFFLGIILMTIIDFLIPHHYLEEKICPNQTIVNPKLFSTGLVVSLGLIIHNFPEGMAVFLSSFGDIKLGILLAFAIALHNIPEGIAVAAPIYNATLSRRKAFKYAFISGISEPVGGLIAFLFLRPYLNNSILAYIFSLVAGIMVYISFDELLPACFRDAHGHHAILGIVVGMAFVALSLLIL